MMSLTGEGLLPKVSGLLLVAALGSTAACSSTPEFEFNRPATVVSHTFTPEHDETVTECITYSQYGLCTGFGDREIHRPDVYGLTLEECDAKMKACVSGYIVVDKVLYEKVPDGTVVTVDSNGEVIA